MAFLNPLFLFGLLAASIPLIIHLWSRRRVVTIDFSSLMFLVAAHRQNVRRVHLKNLLILLLRVLIIMLIALALARPFLTLGLPIATIRAKTDVVIIIDNSYSMRYEDVDGAWFDKGKALGIDVLRSLQQGDSAALILMSHTARPLFRQLTPDIRQVITSIEGAEVSYQTTNVAPSLELAHELLAHSKELNKELYLISDFAQNGWKNLKSVPNRSGARIFLLPVTKQDTHNTNIEEISLSNQLIGVNLPFELNVSTANYSAVPLKQSTLTLFIGGQKRRTMNFSAEADESLLGRNSQGHIARHTLTHTFSTPGTHTGYFTLTSDRLNLDNRRYFAMDALGEIRVLCVGEQTQYLTLALNPGNSTTILPTPCTPAEFETFPIEDYDVIILADVPKISSQIENQLRACIRTGKGIIAFVNSHSRTESYNQRSNVFPATMGPPLRWATPQQVGAYQRTHPIFDIFPREGFSPQYAPQFYNGVTLHPSPEARVLANFQERDGNEIPFLIEQSSNENGSTILLYNCSLQRYTDNAAPSLLTNPYFLPLLHQSVLYTMRAAPKNWHIGDTYIAKYPRSAGAKATIRRILDAGDEVADDLTSSADTITVLPITADGTLRFQITQPPGIYQLEMKTQRGLQRDFFAFNVDTAESNLVQTELQETAVRVGAQTPEPEQETEISEPYNLNRRGREIWGELLILAVGLLLIEGFISNRISHRAFN